MFLNQKNPLVCRLLALLCVVIWGLGNQKAVAGTQTVTLLDRGEPFEGLAFHDAHLWVGMSRRGFSSHYVLEIYGRDLKKVTALSLNHSLTYITPYDAHSVIVVGTGFQPNVTHYTIVTRNGTLFTAVDHPIDVGWANQWIGTLSGREYFTDMGGNPDDEEANQNFQLAGQTFFSVGSNGVAKYLSHRLKMPFAGLRLGSDFYVLQGEGIGSPRTNLVRLNPANNAVVRLFPNPRKGLTKMIALPRTALIAVTESGAQQLLVVDTKTSALVSTTSVGSELRALTALGSCALVGSNGDRTITAVKLHNPANPEKVVTLNLGLAPDDFKSLSAVVADSETGRLYARSNFPCNPLVQVCDKDWNRVITFDGAEATALARACQQSSR